MSGKIVSKTDRAIILASVIGIVVGLLTKSSDSGFAAGLVVLFIYWMAR